MDGRGSDKLTDKTGSAEDKRNVAGRPGNAQLYGIGFEFVAAVAGFVIVGYWVDRHFKTAPWGVLIGLALGLVGGMRNLIRETLRAARSGSLGASENSDQVENDKRDKTDKPDQ